MTTSPASTPEVSARAKMIQDWLNRLTQKIDFSDVHLRRNELPYVRHRGQIVRVPQQTKVTDEILAGVFDLFELSNWRDKLQLEHRIAAAGKVGEYRYRLHATMEVDRLHPTKDPAPSVTLRRLPDSIKTLQQLRVPLSVRKMFQSGSGLILVVGETGSGKTSTLAAIVQEFNQADHYHIATIEDPVEYMHVGEKSLFTRKEVGRTTDSFAGALRDVLREDPDIIMVGEIRDSETMSVALTAAETGHLVLGTLHAAGAMQATERILNMFPPHEHAAVQRTLATTLRGVIAQRLLRPIDDTAERELVVELMQVTKAIANLIGEGKFSQIESAITNAGSDVDRETLVLLNQSLLEATVNRRIHPREAIRAAYNPEDLRLKFKENGVDVSDLYHVEEPKR